MIKIFFIIYSFITSIYSYHFNDAQGSQVAMSSLEGKYILMVNVAGNSSYNNQLIELSELKSRYSDSLIIILFPSNSFGNESRSNVEINNYFTTNYNGKFIVSEKINVANGTVSPVYGWLSNISLNGVVDGVVTTDFQKYLIDKGGSIIGVFSASINPLSSKITNTIEGIE